jgi:hypothetical protein
LFAAEEAAVRWKQPAVRCAMILLACANLYRFDSRMIHTVTRVERIRVNPEMEGGVFAMPATSSGTASSTPPPR